MEASEGPFKLNTWPRRFHHTLHAGILICKETSIAWAELPPLGCPQFVAVPKPADSIFHDPIAGLMLP